MLMTYSTVWSLADSSSDVATFYTTQRLYMYTYAVNFAIPRLLFGLPATVNVGRT